jgi:hypothetical protein
MNLGYVRTYNLRSRMPNIIPSSGLHQNGITKFYLKFINLDADLFVRRPKLRCSYPFLDVHVLDSALTVGGYANLMWVSDWISSSELLFRESKII